MQTLVLRRMAASVLGSVFSMAALAQDPNLANFSPPVNVTAPGDLPSGPTHLRGSGRVRSATWFSAVKFTGRISSAAPQLAYDFGHYYSAPGITSPARYFAQLDLEPGVAVDLITCVVNDSSASNDVSASFQRYRSNVSSGPPSGVLLDSNATSGTAGYQSFSLQPSAAETISTWDGAFGLTQYLIGIDIAQDTSFAGCWAFWTRQISPAPASASFSDVPTSHFAFQAVEALKASTVTTGCTASTYCPDNNVTRAEMALFLARALGLNWKW